MRGSEEKLLAVGGVITELNKESLETLMAASAAPLVLLNERTRPLRAMMNCDGPAAPIVSGGKPEQSGKVAAVKFTELTVCGANGRRVALPGAGVARTAEVDRG